MALPPQKFREAVLQILFTQNFGVDKEELVPFMMKELKTTRKEITAAQARALEVFLKKESIDDLISTVSTEYRLERISNVEKIVLHLGIYELLFDDQIPEKVAIAEAVRLCRKFATPESGQFVNALLDGVYQAHAAKDRAVAETI